MRPDYSYYIEIPFYALFYWTWQDIANTSRQGFYFYLFSKALVHQTYNLFNSNQKRPLKVILVNGLCDFCDIELPREYVLEIFKKNIEDQCLQQSEGIACNLKRLLSGEESAWRKQSSRIFHEAASALNKKGNQCLVKLFWIRILCKMNYQLWFKS